MAQRNETDGGGPADMSFTSTAAAGARAALAAAIGSPSRRSRNGSASPLSTVASGGKGKGPAMIPLPAVSGRNSPDLSLGDVNCPNKSNPYHECSAYCAYRWSLVGRAAEPDLFDLMSVAELRASLRIAKTKEEYVSLKHKEEASEILLKILLEMKQVTAVDYIHCSFPSIDSEAPDLTLTRWDSLASSMWHVKWAPSWSVTIQVNGWVYIPFTLKIVVDKVRVEGDLEMSFSKGIGFVD
eukprot:gene24521-17335_t